MSFLPKIVLPRDRCGYQKSSSCMAPTLTGHYHFPIGGSFELCLLGRFVVGDPPLGTGK
mgnify:CR=1 FL=1